MKIVWEEIDVLRGLHVTCKEGQGVTIFTEEYGPIKVTYVKRHSGSKSIRIAIQCDKNLQIMRHEIKDYQDARKKFREKNKGRVKENPQ